MRITRVPASTSSGSLRSIWPSRPSTGRISTEPRLTDVNTDVFPKDEFDLGRR
jgi:hypothetical protein